MPVRQVVGIRLDGDLPDGIEALRVSERRRQLVDHDRRRAAARVEPLEGKPALPVKGKFLPEGPEVLPAQVPVEDDAVEGAVRAELLAERDMDIEEAGGSRTGRRKRGGASPPEIHGPGELLSRHAPDDGVDHGVLSGCA